MTEGQILDQNPKTQAWDLFIHHKYNDALAVYGKNPNLLKTDPWFTHDYARTLLAAGNQEQVRQAVIKLEELQRKLPNDAQIHASLALAYGRDNRYAQALDMYQRALQLDPKNYEANIINPLSEDHKTRAHRLHERGRNLLFTQKNPLEALVAYEASIALSGEAIGAWAIHDKGIALMQLGHFKDALKSLIKAREYLPHVSSIDNDIVEATNRQTAFIEVRKKMFPCVEPMIHKQIYSDQRGRKRFNGIKVESCTISSAVIALARMGVIPPDSEVMNEVEEEAVRSALSLGLVASEGGMPMSVIDKIFKDFNLKSGYARTQEEMLAAIRAGGCLCPADGHARCVTEISEDGQFFKIFDPLYADTSEVWPISRLRDIAQAAVVVYPNEYQPNHLKGETFTSYNYVQNTHLFENPAKYRIY